MAVFSHTEANRNTYTQKLIGTHTHTSYTHTYTQATLTHTHKSYTRTYTHQLIVTHAQTS